MKNSVFAALLMLIVAGCSTTTPAVNEYTILPVYSSGESLNPPAARSLRITPTKSIASLASKEFYYLQDTTHIGAYLYSRWADTPASMIDRSLLSSLQYRRLFASLLPSGSSANADLTLESNLHAFYHRLKDTKNSEGFIDITYRLINNTSKKEVASKRFVITEPATSPNAQGGADALTLATQRLSQESALWLETISKENKWIK